MSTPARSWSFASNTFSSNSSFDLARTYTRSPAGVVTCVAYSICSVYDEYAIAYDYENNRYVRAYYTKNDEDDSISLGEVVEVYIVDVTESEKKTLDTIQAINGGSFEKADEIYSKNEELTNQVSTLEGQVSEFQTQVETFNSEKEKI